MVVAPVVLALFVAWNERTALFPFVLGVAIAYVIAPAVNLIAGVMPFREARPHLFAALRGEPFRPLALAMLVAAYAPGWLRRALGPVVRPLVAMRYPSWRA